MDMPKDPNSNRTRKSHTTNEALVLRALWDHKAFDSEFAMTSRQIFLAIVGAQLKTSDVRKTVSKLVGRGIIEFVLESGRVPKPGFELNKSSRKYFKDVDEFSDYSWVTNFEGVFE